MVKNKFFVTFNDGLLDVVINELKEFNIKPVETSETFIIFETNNDKAAELSFNMQSINRLSLLVSKTEFTSLKTLTKQLITKFNKSSISEYVDKTFRVSCERLGQHNFQSLDAEKEVGSLLSKFVKGKADMTGFDINYYLYIQNTNALLGIDFSGELSVRDYKVFSNRNSLKGPIAYAAVKLSNFKKGNKLLIIEGGSGELAIEAALWISGKSALRYKKHELPFRKLGFEAEENKKSKGSIYFIDKILANVKACQKNAKIGGVAKNIKYSMNDISWLDVKFEKEEINNIIWNCRKSEKTNKKLLKEYEELFYQAKFILSSKGRILIISRSDNLINIAKKKDFILETKHKISSGKQEDLFLIFKKK